MNPHICQPCLCSSGVPGAKDRDIRFIGLWVGKHIITLQVLGHRCEQRQNAIRERYMAGFACLGGGDPPETNKPFVSIFAAWNTARRKAGLSDVRVHDLRHSFASLLINSGRSLYEVQRLLGHTQIKTTQRYAHLAPETLLAASDAATLAVGSVMGVMPNRVVDVPLVAAQG
jgi:integrase